VGLEALKGGDAPHNAGIARAVLAGEPSPYLDVVLLNAAAALYAADRVSSIDQGVDQARETIKSGAATRKLEQLIEVTHRLKEGLVPA
jgi:anthranilate phosphoribosyltransferase